MTYKIEGITCGACKMLIEMAFEDQGHNGCSVDVDTKTLTVPDSAECGEADVVNIVESAGAYKVIKEEL